LLWRSRLALKTRVPCNSVQICVTQL
jgi:hypothetical protein